MAIMYLTGSEKVLEIGGNIGRNLLIISFILHLFTFQTLILFIYINKVL